MRQRQPHQVDDDVPRGAAANRISELLAGVADDDHVRAVHDLLDRFAEKRGEVGDLLVDVPAVRADQAGERHVAVVDLEVVALAQQRFGEDDHRAFTQVVGARLEAEAKQPDTLAAGLDHLVDRPLHVHVVAVEDRLDDRQVHVQFLGAVLKSAHVLGKAGPAEREAWLQVVRREIEFRVAAEDVHHLVAVHPKPLADRADLVGERHLQRVPRVARVLHHLRDADARADERCVHALVERDGAARVGRVVMADQREGRLAEVSQRAALAEELGVDGDAEALAVLLARGLFQRGDHHFVRRAWEHRATHDDDVVRRFCPQLLSDLSRYPLEIRQVQAAVLPARCADAQQRDFAGAHRFGRVGRRAQPASGGNFAYQIVEPGLDDRAVAFGHAADLVRVDVHADDPVAVGGQRCGRDTPDVPEAEHRNVHDALANESAPPMARSKTVDTALQSYRSRTSRRPASSKERRAP